MEKHSEISSHNQGDMYDARGNRSSVGCFKKEDEPVSVSFARVGLLPLDIYRLSGSN